MSSSELLGKAKASDRYDLAVLVAWPPTAALSARLMPVAARSIACGLILAYLALRALGQQRQRS